MDDRSDCPRFNDVCAWFGLVLRRHGASKEYAFSAHANVHDHLRGGRALGALWLQRCVH